MCFHMLYDENIYVYMCVCVWEEMSWIWQNVEKVKQNKNVWWFVYFPMRFNVNLFCMHKYFIQIIL